MTASPISSFTTFGGFTRGGFVASAAPENRAVIDLPVNGSTVTDTFRVAGWAIQENAAGGTDVDTVHVWAHPVSGAAPIPLGAAVMGDARPDVAAIFGAQYLNARYHLDVTGLADGTYDIRAYVHDASTGLFDIVRTTRVTVRLPVFDVRMFVDLPAADAVVPGSFPLAGWALVLGGSPIETIHVWVVAPGSSVAQLLGVAMLGDPRPDVAAAFGPAFANAGFHLDVSGLAPGPHTLLVFAKAMGAADFAPAQVGSYHGGRACAIPLMSPGVSQRVLIGWIRDQAEHYGFRGDRAAKSSAERDRALGSRSSLADVHSGRATRTHFASTNRPCAAHLQHGDESEA